LNVIIYELTSQKLGEVKREMSWSGTVGCWYHVTCLCQHVIGNNNVIL